MGGSSGAPGGGYVPRTPREKGSGGGGEGSGGGDDPCTFSITTSLASPNPTVVANLHVGNVLQLELNESGATPVVEVHFEADVAGTIAGIPNLRALIGCMRLGVSYEFRVRAITGGRVDGTLRNN